MAKRPRDVKVWLDRLAEKSHELVAEEPSKETLNSKESPKKEMPPKKKQTLRKEEPSKEGEPLNQEKKEGTFGTEMVKKWKPAE